jgi:putative ABC transport system substrate-binding protein
MTRGRLTLLLALSLVAAPLAAEAQPLAKVPRIGVLSFGHPPSATGPSDPNEGFRQGLHDLGYVEGSNVITEWRYAETRTDRLAELAVELVQLKVDVIHAGGPVVLEAAIKATATIPIVVVGGEDVVTRGWAQSLARPGGNITGLTVTYPEVGPKRLAILKEAIPGLSRVVALREPGRGGSSATYARAMEDGARVLGVQLQVLELRGPNDFERAFSLLPGAEMIEDKAWAGGARV